MTSTTESPAGTALAQVADGALARLQDAKPWTIADLADLVTAPSAGSPAGTPAPEPARAVSFTPALRKALAALPRVFGKVSPTERRKLEAAEVRELTDEANVIAALAKPLKDRLEAISEIIRHHCDFVAADQGKAGTIVTSGVAAGHVLVATSGKPFEVAVEGYAEAWSQRYVKGGSSQSPDKLLALYEDGTISRAEYLACTRETRSLDTRKVEDFIRKSPVRGLQILAAITTRSDPTASLYMPKK